MPHAGTTARATSAAAAAAAGDDAAAAAGRRQDGPTRRHAAGTGTGTAADAHEPGMCCTFDARLLKGRCPDV